MHFQSSAITLSLDNTFKISNKITVRDKHGTYTKLLKGGVSSVLNENNQTIAWVSIRNVTRGLC